MKKDSILKISLGILYYIFCLILFYYMLVFELFGGSVSAFSSILFYICYIIIPIILLLTPLIFKFIFKKTFKKSISYSVIMIIIHMFILLIINFGINVYFSKFSSYKWMNSNWNYFRYGMIEDLENRYNIKGMTKEEIYKLLGNEDTGIYTDDEYTISYYIRAGFFNPGYYNITFDKNNIVIDVGESFSK